MNKTILIIIAAVLFLGVVFQALVIVDYHSDEFNPGFYRKLESPPVYYESFNQTVADQFFKPFDIYIRDGEKTWILKKDEDLFNTLWQDGQEILLSGLTNDLTISTKTWAEISDKPGILYKMGTNIPVELLIYLMDADVPETVIQSIEKFVVVPGSNTMDIFYKSGNTIYEITGMSPSGLFTESNFIGLINLLGVDPYYSVNSYTEDHKFIDAEVLNKYIEPDIPVILDVASKSLPWYELSVPELIKNYITATGETDEETKKTMIEESSALIKSQIISRTINTYEMHLDSIDNLYFSNQFNIYEVTKDGWISYNYTEGTEGDTKGSLGAAFMNAVETLSSITGLSENQEDTYLSGIIQNEDSYSFTFDYRFNGNVLVIDGADHAAVIRATETRTIEASVYPVNIKEMTGDQYIDSQYKTVFFFITNYNGITNINTIEAYDMYIGYVKTSALLEVVEPVWVIEKVSGEKQVLNLVSGD